MSIWKPEPATTEPMTKIWHWRIFEVLDKIPSIHLVGSVAPYGSLEGRVSSHIINLDQHHAITRSSRKYLFQTEQANYLESDADYVLNRWLHYNNIEYNNIKWHATDSAIQFLQNRSKNGKKD